MELEVQWDLGSSQNYITQRQKAAKLLLIRSFCCSVTRSCLTLCSPTDAARQAALSFTVSQLSQTLSPESVMPSNHLVLCHPLLLPSIFPSIRVFSNQLTLLIRWPQYWSFSFSISPSNEHSGLISFRMDWFDLLTVQGTLMSLRQQHSSKPSVLQCSVFFMVQLSRLCVTTGKTTALSIQTFIVKVMSLLFNTLSRFVIAVLPRRKCQSLTHV